MISYLVRYNWAIANGLIQIPEEYKGVAYSDMETISLDETVEYSLAVAKNYGLDYEFVTDRMPYVSVSVLYAKYANEQAFKRYDEYLRLDEKTQSDYVYNYGEPKPYVFKVKTRDTVIKETNSDKNGLRNMYNKEN